MYCVHGELLFPIENGEEPTECPHLRPKDMFNINSFAISNYSTLSLREQNSE